MTVVSVEQGECLLGRASWSAETTTHYFTLLGDAFGVSALHLLVRTAHVLAVISLVGGAGVCWLRLDRETAVPLDWLRGYEWLFWVALGLVVATGVGNLGAVGPPGPTTPWGQTLLVKLAVVGVIVVGSLPRTVAVIAWRQSESNADPETATLSRLYGLTTLTLVTVVVLAEVLAHG
ncbi:MAG: CopD family protein [Halobaculum sp.]